MKKLLILLTSTSLVLGLSSLKALDANINWGSAPDNPGSAQFFGDDAAVADSIALGYFTGNSANADLTGWNSIVADSSFEGGAVNFGTSGVYDVTSAAGNDAWILITDGALTGLVRGSSWSVISGATAPTPTPALKYEIGASDTSATLTALAGTGTAISIGAGGGFGGSGVSIQLSAVPEPSAFALLSGALALGWVMVRRRA